MSGNKIKIYEMQIIIILKIFIPGYKMQNLLVVIDFNCISSEKSDLEPIEL